MNIQIDHLNLSLADFHSSVRLYYKKAIRGSFSSFVVFTVLSVLLLLSKNQSDPQVLFIINVVLALGAAYVRFIFFPISVPNSMYKAFRQHGVIQIVIDDTGILEKAETVQAFHKWEQVVDYKEDRTGIIICLLGTSWLYLPHSYLTPEQRRELKERLESRIKEAKESRKA